MEFFLQQAYWMLAAIGIWQKPRGWGWAIATSKLLSAVLGGPVANWRALLDWH
jgi:hypothetical protein